MTDTSTVRLGIGLGEIRFGASIEEAVRYFGMPDERHEEPEFHGITTISLDWNDGVACWFDSDDDYRLGTIQVEHGAAELCGETLIGRPLTEVLMLVEPHLGVPTWDDFTGRRLDLRVAEFDDHGLMLWFEDHHLEAIQWGYLWDGNDQKVWPSAELS